ncbi:hypothetical protein IY73_04255 [Lawsonella clevelandensis]|uniref:hypothetical protein n=1 Tax=Lawsonella clevelandensis TaxID=1528099 RepID=UPI0006B5FCC7|nr:hypothetical protein [Lawsonella clevelandensis]ALE34658.1 hypothetical protein IY73_04255 [Lawsonella clevelandensis]
MTTPRGDMVILDLELAAADDIARFAFDPWALHLMLHTHGYTAAMSVLNKASPRGQVHVAVALVEVDHIATPTLRLHVSWCGHDMAVCLFGLRGSLRVDYLDWAIGTIDTPSTQPGRVLDLVTRAGGGQGTMVVE